MSKAKPYLSFSQRRPGAKSLLLKRASEKNNEVLREKTVEEHRDAQNMLADMRLIPPTARMEKIICAGVPCEWVSRADSPAGKVILYLHGGSWAFGNLKTAKAVGVLLTEATNYRVLVVEYRLSPEYSYPAGLDDCRTVYGWLREQGFAPGDIALFGDSAGGNLSLCLLHRLLGEGQPLPCAVALASPVTDLTANSEIYRRKPDLFYTNYADRRQDIFSLYTGENDRENPLISPVYGELQAFPPLLIHVGGDEELVIDCDRFAAKAYAEGVDVRLKIWKELFHDFSIFGITLKESRQSMKEFGAFLKLHLGSAD